MVQILGGDMNTDTYKIFVSMCIRGYLAARPFVENIVRMLSLMSESGLPCFKGNAIYIIFKPGIQTLRKLRERFQPGKTEKQAAEFMMAKIKESHENSRRYFTSFIAYRSKLYDGFQYMQNGIPY